MPQGFGWFALIQSTALMLQGLGGLGLGLATTSNVARIRQQDPQRAGRIISFSILFTFISGIVMAFLILVAPAKMLQSLLGTSDYKDAIKLLGPLTLLGMTNKIQGDVMIGLEAFRQIATVSMIRGIATVVLAAIGAYLFGPSGAVTGLAAAWLLATVISQASINRTCKDCGICLVWGQSFSEYRLLGTYMFFAASSLVIAIVNWALNILLARQQGGLVELAIFNAADRWRTAMLFVPGLLAQVSLPMFASAHARSSTKTCIRLLLMAGSVALASTMVWLVIVVLIGPVLMATYGQGFIRGNKVLLVLAIGCVPTAISMVGAYCLWAAGRTKTMLMIDLIRASITLSYCLSHESLSAVDASKGLLLGYTASTPILAIALWQAIAPSKIEAR